jgi:acyl-coenzyme A synthetase/AMP-(fatty) acid ligase
MPTPPPVAHRPVDTADAAFPLVGRRQGDVLFHSPAQTEMTAAMFLAAAHRLAAELPNAGYAINLCQDRLSFSVAFAACVARGQVSLLTSDRSPERIRQLTGQFPGLYALTDEAEPTIQLDQVAVRASFAVPNRAPPNPMIPADRLAAVVFTSGSTGEPVGHRKLWGALTERSRDAARRFGIAAARSTSIVGMVPPQHMYGFETTVLLPLHANASVWCGAAFFPSDVRAALAAVVAPRVLVTTPLQIRAVLQSGLELPPLRRVISATAPLFADMAAEAEARWHTEVWEIFGATEIGSIASRRTVEGDLWTTYPRVRVRPGELDEEVMATGPFAEPYPIADRVDAPDAGHFRLLGRRTDLLKLAGRRASLAGLNRVLAAIDGVVDGLFVPPADLDTAPTARMMAFVVAPERSPDDILAALRARIDPAFLPRRVVKVDRLPRNAVGKLPEQALGALRAAADPA